MTFVRRSHICFIFLVSILLFGSVPSKPIHAKSLNDQIICLDPAISCTEITSQSLSSQIQRK